MVSRRRAILPRRRWFCGGVLLAALLAIAAAQPAAAHPHVWVTARAQFTFDGDRIAAIRHSWTFDTAYSHYATQGLDVNGDGKLDATELAELASANVEGLYEFDFFSKVKANGVPVTFTKVTDPVMEFTAGVLTLHFTLPVDPPAAADRVLAAEIYDPTYFVSFLFAPGDDAATVAGRGEGCSITVKRPEQRVFGDDEDLSEAFFDALTAASSFGQDFATRAIIACP